MKKICCFCLVFILVGCSSQKGFENYRDNPFQFPYQEYYLKADIQTVQPNKAPETSMTIDAFGMSFSIDTRFADDVVRRNGIYIVRKSGEKVLVVMQGKEEMMGCNDVVKENEKDFCSAFASTKAYLEKLFLLTPKNLSEEQYRAAGNRWIVHNKGALFKNVDKISIYRSSSFEAFRTDFRPSNNQTRVDLRIFHQNIAPDFIIIGFVDKNETLIKQILSTIH